MSRQPTALERMHLKFLFWHILPNIFSPLLVQATISISFAILDESVLSFLGLGAHHRRQNGDQ